MRTRATDLLRTQGRHDTSRDSTGQPVDEQRTRGVFQTLKHPVGRREAVGEDEGPLLRQIQRRLVLVTAVVQCPQAARELVTGQDGSSAVRTSGSQSWPADQSRWARAASITLLDR